MAGPDGVADLGGRIDQAMSPAMESLRDCLTGEGCLAVYQEAWVPPQDVIGLFDAYVRRVHEVVDAVGAFAEDDPEGEGADVVGLAEQWSSASLLTARAAASLVACLDDAMIDGSSSDMRRCATAGEMYGASVLDHNRLRNDFRRQYLAYAQRQGTSP